MAERTTVKLRDVKITFPHLGCPDRFGKYSATVLVPKKSQAEAKLYAALADAWAKGTDAFGKSLFEQNPTRIRLEKAAYLQIGGSVDSKGKPLPSWKDDFICFGLGTDKPPVVVDGNLEPMDANSAEIYDGQNVNISFDLVPFSNPESHNMGFSKYIRSVVILGGGERISTQSGGFSDIVEEWGDED